MNETLFIAGGGGFLGTHAVYALDRSRWKAVSLGLGAPPASAPFHAHHDGLIKRGLLSAASAVHGPPDVIVHAAGGASVGRSFEDPRGDFELTVGSTVEILDFMRREAPDARLVLISSAAVYGEAGRLPLEEDDACAPISPYGAHKKICEDLAAAETRMRGLGVVVLRFFSLYGEGLRKQILWDLLERGRAAQGGALKLWGDGAETRDFLHAQDAGRLIAAACAAARQGESQCYNGASGEAVTIRTLAESLLDAAGLACGVEFNGAARPGDPRHLTADTSRLRRRLGFSPSVQLSEGLSRYAQWHAAAVR